MTDTERKEAHNILDQTVNTDVWDIPIDDKNRALAGGQGGRLVCGACGKTYSWKDWAPLYSHGAMTRMAKHLVEAHGYRIADEGKAVSSVYLGVYGHDWMDEKFKDV